MFKLSSTNSGYFIQEAPLKCDATIVKSLHNYEATESNGNFYPNLRHIPVQSKKKNKGFLTKQPTNWLGLEVVCTISELSKATWYSVFTQCTKQPNLVD